MDYRFSNKVSSLKPSLIREILKMSSVPGMIPFSAGNPAPDAFPSEALAKISDELLKNRPIDALQYSITEGYGPLRDAIRKRYSYLFGPDDDVIITSGAQQVMNLTTQSLCDEGDVIICENPSFIGSLNAFRSFNARLVGVDMDECGMKLDMLENALKENKNAKFIYIIPNFQNPSGLTTTLERRKAIYELAKKYGVVILEDNPYGETRFEGDDVPSIKSMDTDNIVVYAGSFSKVISPGLRVGYAIAPKALLAKMTVCKQVQDVHSVAYSQIVINEFMTSDGYDAHLENIRKIYKRKCDLMCNGMTEQFGDKIRLVAKPQGGLFVWCKLPDGADMLDFCKKGIERGVAVVPGTAFLTDESQPCIHIRANYSTPSDEQIVKGIEIMAQLAKELY